MKKIILLTIFLHTLIYSYSQKALDYVPNQIIVTLDDDASINHQLAIFHEDYPNYGKLEVIQTIGTTNPYFLLEFNTEKVDFPTIQTALLNSAIVDTATPDYYIYERDSIPDDPFFDAQWTLETINITDVWNISSGGTTSDGKKIVVAVIDSGFDINHEEFIDNTWTNAAEIPNNNIDDDNNGFIDDVNGWNFKEDLPIHPYDNPHGTSVAGIIGAKGDNNTGISGINWNVELMFFTVGTTSQIGAALAYAGEQRALYNATNGEEGAYVVVTNTSLGRDREFCSQHPVWANQFDILGEQGILNVAATTNGNINVDFEGDMPTSCESDYLLTVTNIGQTDNLAGSGYGSESIDMGAPGGLGAMATYTTDPENLYDMNFGGTSAAAPHVAGVAALLYTMPCSPFNELAEQDPPAAVLLMKKALMEGGAENASIFNQSLSGKRLDAQGSMVWMHGLCQIMQENTLTTEELIEEAMQINPANYFGESIDFYRIFPNPVSDELRIEYILDEFRDLDFVIYDAAGRTIVEFSKQNELFEAQFLTIDVSNYPSGTYFLSIRNGKQPVTTKFVVLPK